MKRNFITRAGRFTVAGFLAGLVCSAPAFAAEDQWYDPTDWFDGNNVESDDTYDGYYDYSYDYDYDGNWNDYDDWGRDDWNSDYYDSDYWDNYDWSDNARTSSSRGTASSTSAATSSRTVSTSGSKNNSSQSSNQANTTDNTSSANDALVYTYILFTEPIASQKQENQADRSQATSGSNQRSQQKHIARLSGTVEGLRQMNLQRRSGATGPHTIAKIKLDNGKTTVVTLGRSSQLSDLNLMVGDRIQAIGRKGMIDGETVFVAHSLRAKGQTVAANPAIRLNRTEMSDRHTSRTHTQNQAGGKANPAQATLQGEVASISRASMGQSNNQRTLVDIKLENGKSSTVDFGPAASLEKIGVEEGENITVRGRRDTVNGREVIVADLLKVDGEKVSSVSR